VIRPLKAVTRIIRLSFGANETASNPLMRIDKTSRTLNLGENDSIVPVHNENALRRDVKFAVGSLAELRTFAAGRKRKIHRIGNRIP